MRDEPVAFLLPDLLSHLRRCALPAHVRQLRDECWPRVVCCVDDMRDVSARAEVELVADPVDRVRVLAGREAVGEDGGGRVGRVGAAAVRA